jgi:hypothetical protein
MRWYDYVSCFVAADIITASLVAGDIFGLTLGIVGYILYEKLSIWSKETD